ncbi:NAD(P)/FAD-dependent oxidoreductase [Luteolibacter flavescens]|uniref:NAD(P)/FAD-dependent oxidoreductase n=1 Tax=Luteolibacter flavescens TaxID=1859460 RepID=A0ABT3FT78_9BACT|nr:NAD(P)/FAD-dependent oxidoreductase [Luteolibacter flavescens]MCW1886783.1 NAD(P)/FAD-dependent oxidoreductase [Luteolibacter flavescens]
MKQQTGDDQPRDSMKLAVIGGGPAGLRAAEVAAQRGASVTVFDAKPSVGRKLLVAGRGGLNITHGEDLERFISRYSGPPDFWQHAISSFTPSDLREWAAGLGIETFEQRTGRVYPREMKAAPLLRRWVDRLRALGVTFAMNHRWTGLKPGPPHEVGFSIYDEHRTYAFDAVILALGGASWSITGSDGKWTSILEGLGVEVTPLAPANCGWETEWSAEVLRIAEGHPLKNLVIRAGNYEAKGELMVTSYGLEGGAIYQLGAALRSMNEPTIHIDFKPTFSTEELAARLTAANIDPVKDCKRLWKLSDAAHAILCDALSPATSALQLAARAKNFPVRFKSPRPIDESISSAGGVCWDELYSNLMLRKFPGIFLAGEMIDWEAPTGGYLMQGCFATATIAAISATV